MSRGAGGSCPSPSGLAFSPALLGGVLKRAGLTRWILPPALVQDSSEPPVKKLAIREEPAEHEKYEFETVPVVYSGEGSKVLDRSDEVSLALGGVELCGGGTARLTLATDQLDELAAAVLSSMSSAQKSEVKAWEEEIVACAHTTGLVQPNSIKLEPSGEFS